MAVTGAILPKQYANTINLYAQTKKYFPVQHRSVIKEKKQKIEKILSYPILCPLFHIHQRKQIKTKSTQLSNLLQCRMSSAYRQGKKASTKRGHFISQVHNTEVKWSIKPCIVRTKKVSKALRQKLVEWIMKNSNVCESPIARDTLLITDEESGVKLIVPKLLLEFSMRQLHNELIVSPYYGGLFGARHADTNYVIISDKMLRFLAPPQLNPMTDNQKMMCGCAIFNTSKYFQ